MKRNLIIGIVALAMFTFPVFAADEISCDNLPESWNLLAEKAFVKNKKTQRLFTKCGYGQMIMVLREENRPDGEHLVKAGAYFLGSDFVLMERKSHPMDVLCDIQKTSNSDRIDYLCYNPTVAAGSVGGEEFSFRLQKRRSYRRDCTVFFGGLKDKECGKWKRIK